MIAQKPKEVSDADWEAYGEWEKEYKRLANAAPDLLEALQDILKVWPDCLKSTGELETQLHAKALAAVKKATEA